MFRMMHSASHMNTRMWLDPGDTRRVSRDREHRDMGMSLTGYATYSNLVMRASHRNFQLLYVMTWQLLSVKAKFDLAKF